MNWQRIWSHWKSLGQQQKQVILATAGSATILLYHIFTNTFIMYVTLIIIIKLIVVAVELYGGQYGVL